MLICTHTVRYDFCYSGVSFWQNATLVASQYLSRCLERVLLVYLNDIHYSDHAKQLKCRSNDINWPR